MQDIENNMDELFRKAAENYAPKKGESKWNDILPALSENLIEASITKKNNSKKNIAFLLAVSLIIFSAIILMENSGHKNKTVHLQANKTAEKNNTGNSNADVDNTNEKSGLNFDKKIKQKISTYNRIEKIIETNQNTIVKNTQRINSFNIGKNYSELSMNIFKHDEENVEDIEADSINKAINQLDNIDNAKNAIDKKPFSLKKQRRLYIGFVAAPEFSQIKNQGIKKPGYDIGVIAGYNLSSKTSVETGLLLNKKNYFSDGKYFSMDKIGATIPSGMEVMNLKGSSTFLQIPVKLKYDVLHKKNTTIFSSAGISSYIITDEENDYLTLLNGTEQRMKGSYKNVVKYFAATVDVSAGYENKIGKFANIRIEPYMQVPLKGTGMGSMPVMSAGLHIGIIKFIR